MVERGGVPRQKLRLDRLSGMNANRKRTIDLFKLQTDPHGLGYPQQCQLRCAAATSFLSGLGSCRRALGYQQDTQKEGKAGNLLDRAENVARIAADLGHAQFANAPGAGPGENQRQKQGGEGERKEGR